ncbi:FAD-dependent oxidoreductase [Chloroflexota bacterium]
MGLVYPKLFEPVNIGKVTIKNRIAMAPMGIVGLTNQDGSLTQRAVDYYVERAKGGTGLIITSLFKVENELDTMGGQSQTLTPAGRMPLKELCEQVHAQGTKIFIQLTAGWGRVARVFGPDAKPVSASVLPDYWNPNIICRALETEEVERIVTAFGFAAQIAAGAGIDGIELHGHEGYLFDQFTTALWNNRTDKYGGDLKQRLTFPIEVLNIIKKRVGTDFPVQYRFGLKHYIKGLNSGAVKGEEYTEAGRDVEEGLEMAKLLEEAGFDSLHVDAGCYDSWYWAHPPVYQEHGCMVDMAAMAKKVVKIPVVAVGRLDIPEMAESVIAEGKADMVAIGRGLLADAYWPIKTAEGKTEDIRPCMACHDGCIGRFGRGPLSCAVNPACGRENQYRLTQAGDKRKVLVAGGGISGMEAARVAAIRGHSVVLYEKENFLGGHLIEASVPEFKKDLKRQLDWYEIQLKKLGIEVKQGVEVSAELVEKENPDIVILATGSKVHVPGVPGIDKGNVITCIDLLLGKKEVSRTAVVIGGGLIGCETALWLSQNGKEVTIVEMLPELMLSDPPVPHMNRIMLLDLLAYNNVKIETGARLQEITNEGIIVTEDAYGKKEINADTVVIATGLESEDKLYKSLAGKVARLYAIGDSREPRNIMGAVWDGYEVGSSI